MRRREEEARSWTIYDDSTKFTLICGSISTANVVPSLVETYFTTKAEARIVLEHQCGSAVEDVCLQSDAGPGGLLASLHPEIRTKCVSLRSNSLQ